MLGDLGAFLLGSAVGGDPLTGVLTGLLAMALYGNGGLYRSRLRLSLLDDLPSLAGRGLVAATTVQALKLIVARDEQLDWAPFVMLGSVFTVRFLAYRFVALWRRLGLVVHRTLILGTGVVGTQIADSLAAHPEYGLQPVGFVDSLLPTQRDPQPDDPSPVAPQAQDPHAGSSHLRPVISGPQQLSRAVSQHSIDVVIVAFGQLREPDMVQILRTCDRLRVDIFFVPRLFELGSLGNEVEQVWGIPLVRLRRLAFRRSARAAKRALDLGIAGLAVFALAPIFGCLALAVRVANGRGVLFRQRRIGLDSRPFTLLKFRSMARRDPSESDTHWSATPQDSIGRVGRFIRATSLDELPQLLNVLRGDMSLVGPRPERPHFVEDFSRAYPHYLARHRLPAGLTGWAQIHGLRGDTSISDRIRFDNAYIEGWSLWLDVKILLRTIPHVFRRTGS